MKAKKIIVFALALSISAMGMGIPNTVLGAETDVIANTETTESDFDFEPYWGMITNYSGDEENVVIPSEIDGVPVTCIGTSTFQDNTRLKSVTIPDSITEIEYFAFLNCENLTEIIIPENVTTIKTWAFKGCTSLESIQIPDSVNNIEWEVFADTPWLEEKYKEGPMIIINGILLDGTGCKGEITIPDGVTMIEQSAFYDCQDITSVTIPDSVTSIKDDAFNRCRNLTSVTIPDSVREFGWDVFVDTPWLEAKQKEDPLVTVNGVLINTDELKGEITIPDSVTSFGKRVFWGWDNITGVKFSDNMTSIDEELLYHCLGLTSVTIPDSVTSIEENAFSTCENLTSVTIPGSVTTIGRSAFCCCNSLTNVTLSEGITSIAFDAFLTCGNLKSITIPDSVTSIGECAFGYTYERGLPVKTPGFTIKAHMNTAAQKYAEENGFNFIPLDNITDTVKSICSNDTLKGDCNKDGTVSTADCVTIQKFLLNLDSELPDEIAADVNGDEIINVMDLVMIKNMLL